MQIDIKQLRIVANILFDHLEESGRKTVEIMHDYYWYIPEEQLYNPYVEPTQFTMGQLTDDWSEMQMIINYQSPTIGYAFVWLSAILRALGETVVG